MAPKSKAQRRKEWWEKLHSEMAYLYGLTGSPMSSKDMIAHIRRGLRLAKEQKI